MKNLLANRPNVVIVADSARIHFDETQWSLHSGEFSSAEIEAGKSKTDCRWKCKSQSPSVDDSTKAKDIPIEKPVKQRLFTKSPTKSSKSQQPSSKSSKPETKSSTAPDQIPTAEEQDAKKAQMIIGLVQSLAFRAATAVKNAKQIEKESASRASE